MVFLIMRHWLTVHCAGGEERYTKDPHFNDLLLFYEYFDGNTGRGCGAR